LTQPSEHKEETSELDKDSIGKPNSKRQETSVLLSEQQKNSETLSNIHLVKQEATIRDSTRESEEKEPSKEPHHSLDQKLNKQKCLDESIREDEPEGR
jgi:hypothetical protein